MRESATIPADDLSSDRQTKRQATAHRIAEAMLTLTEQRGFEAVTVDDVAEAAGVSRRTFFNYFAAKEDALFGNPADDIIPDALARFIEGGPSGHLVDDLMALVAAQNLHEPFDLKKTSRLKAVFEANPQLIGQFKKRHAARARELGDLIAHREGWQQGDDRIGIAVAVTISLVGATIDRSVEATDLDEVDFGAQLSTTLTIARELFSRPDLKD